MAGEMTRLRRSAKSYGCACSIFTNRAPEKLSNNSEESVQKGDW